MNLDNLKPAWQRFRFMNSIPSMNQQEILFILERAEGVAISKTNRVLILTIVFAVVTFFCQGG